MENLGWMVAKSLARSSVEFDLAHLSSYGYRLICIGKSLFQCTVDSACSILAW
jgi:hypothetical protein